jgi:hypothetical protein
MFSYFPSLAPEMPRSVCLNRGVDWRAFSDELFGRLKIYQEFDLPYWEIKPDVLQCGTHEFHVCITMNIERGTVTRANIVNDICLLTNMLINNTLRNQLNSELLYTHYDARNFMSVVVRDSARGYLVDI